MRTAFVLLAACVALCHARLPEKVSEDEHFVVYRVPVGDLQSQASGHYDLGAPGASFGRSASKSSSHSKSSSSSTGSGKGKGYGEGSSSHGSGHGGGGGGSGYGGSGSGHGGSGSGYGGSGSGYGGSGSGYGGSGSGYGGSGSGYGGSGSGYGGSGSGYGGSGSGYGGSGSGYGGSHSVGGQASYTPYESQQGGSPGYDSEEQSDYPKVVTSTKTFTTNSAQDSGYQPQSQYRQGQDSVGDINFRLADYLKNSPGHDAKYSQKIFDDFMAANPGYRSSSGQQGFNINEFTRSLNRGMGGHRHLPQASALYPAVAYGLRHAGFGL